MYCKYKICLKTTVLFSVQKLPISWQYVLAEICMYNKPPVLFLFLLAPNRIAVWQCTTKWLVVYDIQYRRPKGNSEDSTTAGAPTFHFIEPETVILNRQTALCADHRGKEGTRQGAGVGGAEPWLYQARSKLTSPNLMLLIFVKKYLFLQKSPPNLFKLPIEADSHFFSWFCWKLQRMFTLAKTEFQFFCFSVKWMTMKTFAFDYFWVFLTVHGFLTSEDYQIFL